MKVEMHIEKLESLLEALDSDVKVRVGIMGSENRRADGLSNATIGAIHEFGMGVPQRSFLRQPLIDNAGPAIEAAVNQQDVEEMINTESMVPFMRKVGIISEEVVQQAFDTAGNGKWPKWITPGYSSKTGNILVDTTQLRDSITSAVESE